jgi:hypothetical protein
MAENLGKMRKFSKNEGILGKMKKLSKNEEKSVKGRNFWLEFLEGDR